MVTAKHGITQSNLRFDQLTFLEEGKFTKIDETIKEIAKHMASEPSPFRAMSEKVSKLRYISETTEWDLLFRKRTGSEVLNSGRTTGCTDDALAFIVMARALGVPARYVEALSEDWVKGRIPLSPIKGHVFVEIEVDGKWRVYDPVTGYTPDNRLVLHSVSYIEIGKGLDFSAIYVNDGEKYESKPIDISDIRTLRQFRHESVNHRHTVPHIPHA